MAKNQRQAQKNRDLASDQSAQNATVEQETTITSYREEVFIGPFPHPDILKAYGDFDPSIPAKIMDMAVAESIHRRAIESRVVKWQSRMYLINNVFAIIAMGIILLVGYLFMVNGHPKEGAAIIGVTCLGTVGIIITRTFRKDNHPQPVAK